MSSSENATSLFYDYLDVDDKDAWLHKLQSSNLADYLKIQPLIQAHSSDELHLTAIIDDQLVQCADSVPNLSGHTVDKFKVGEQLDEGGMSVVYLAERKNKTFDQSVVIKFFRRSLHKLLDRSTMFNEAKMLARLNHPNIVKVIDGGSYQGINYLVMERIEGRKLNEFLAHTRYSKKQRLELFLKVCSAISHAHKHQTLHADLKPENILVEACGTPKVIDFNMIQRDEQDSEESSILALSHRYAAPEQKEGDYLTNSADIYSLGVIIKELLSGVDDQNETNQKNELRLIIDKATHLNIGERYQYVEQFADDIRCYLAYQPTSLNRSFSKRLTLLCRRRPIVTALSSLLVISTFCFLALLVVANQKIEREKATVEKMLLELTAIFHYESSHPIITKNIIDVAKKRLLSNPSLPEEIRHKLLLSDFIEPKQKPESLMSCDSSHSCKE
ncbi:serine/threonine protein kinase [Vibrio genomosp. F10 str. 9ZC157]|uniref:serine/threonine protein kinase n=2 Tax=Vibrio genomosp. F10 TaxID=723171 RepID=UPI0002DC3B12|nr:serine/threonine-protein kinase [Vibrio genomosp. F10]OEE97094.1 hypothetical protein A1QM_15585 [Vibrio genomosp. F10 str. 9ZC157]